MASYDMASTPFTIMRKQSDGRVDHGHSSVFSIRDERDILGLVSAVLGDGRQPPASSMPPAAEVPKMLISGRTE